MIPFLKSIAKAYASRYADMSEFCFLFPNKRSGTFFLKYLREECGRHLMLSPEIRSITDFVTEVSGRVVASRVDLLFMLYQSYRTLMGLPVEEEDDEEGVHFDSFCGWGETVLSDFNEVDLYMVDAGEVFKNVKDYREISSNFLTEEQKRVMFEYFGRTDNGDPNQFWKNFEGDEEKLSEAKKKFLHLWRTMSPLYESLHEKLASRGLATNGSLYRLAAERLRDEGRDVLPYKKVVAVGFNALSTSEQTLFKALRDSEGYDGYDAFADFFWDATGPVLSKDVNSASKFVKSNIKAFPSPQWAEPALKLSDREELPDSIRVAASPSNSAQVKIAGTMLKELRAKLSADEFKDARVAVVLPDENMLLPMLYSLPAGMGDVNLTMGYPLRLTSVVPFVSLLRRLLQNMRKPDGEKSFYHRDLRLFLAHPFSHACFTTKTINEIIGYLDSHHKAVMTLEELNQYSPKAAEMLARLDPKGSPQDSARYLSGVLEEVAEALPSMEDAMVKSRLEISHIEVYRDALRRLGDVLEEYGVRMKPATVFRLADKVLAGEKVGFEGEPLEGLQVMGMLETRSIDFDHIFILSANERILPMRARTRSFIPDSLRHAFGMPPSNYAEGIFAYYFYRMISRAKGVTMIYDGRSGAGLSSGDVSRYVLQLRHLFAKDKLVEEDWKFILSGKEPHDASIEKTEEVMRQLQSYCEPGGRRFSVSSLKAYRECEVKFFFKTVMRLDEDGETSTFLDSISTGNIFHRAMLELYHPDPDNHKAFLQTPVLMQKSTIEALIKDRKGLETRIRRLVNKMHFQLGENEWDRPLPEGVKIVAQHIVNHVMNVLRHDLRLAPFRIYGCEMEDILRIKLPGGKEINFTFAIDRLDEIMVDGQPRLRIIDYKTGNTYVNLEEFDEVFTGGYKGDQIFQLMSYAWLLQHLDPGIRVDNVGMEIYGVTKILNKDNQTVPQIGEEVLTSYDLMAGEFEPRMEEMLDSIFTKPVFEAAEDESECTGCSFRSLCRR